MLESGTEVRPLGEREGCGYFLKVEATGFLDGLNLGCERKRNQR